MEAETQELLEQSRQMPTDSQPTTKEIGANGNSPSTEECPRCSGDGYILRNGKAYPCGCALERKIISRLPARYHKARLSDFDVAIKGRVAVWFEKPTDGFFLTGPVGTGKTHLACAMLRAAMEIGFCGQRKRDRYEELSRPYDGEAVFKRCAEFYLEIRRTYISGSRDSELAVIEKLSCAGLLVLDDLGAGKVGADGRGEDFERRAFLELLDRRLNDLRPTIVTSNLARKEVASRIDERVASRLNSFTGIHLSGKDRRDVLCD